MKRKTRKEKKKIYNEKYKGIPVDYEERLSWMVDKYKLSESKMKEILEKRNEMINNLFFYHCRVVQLLEEPEGASRPKFRLVNKSNFNHQAIQHGEFVHVYVPNAQDDFNYMRRLTSEQDLLYIDQLINTPCIIEYNAYIKTPSYYNTTDIFLSEIGLIRPSLDKPDWDNIGKKYCDMYNHNIWLDDTLVITGTVNKFYSILPRIEIKLHYLNALYNKAQFNRVTHRKDYDYGEIHYIDNKGRII